MVGQSKYSFHLQFFFALLDYSNTIKTSTRFTPFQLVYGLEDTLSIKCKIPSLKHAIELLPNTTLEEYQFLYLNKLDETCQYDTLSSELHK